MAEATPGSSGILGRMDEVSDGLLRHVSLHVYYGKQREFAENELNINPKKFKSIQRDKQGDPDKISYQLLIRWSDLSKAGVKVGNFMDNLVAWQRAGYLRNTVWQNMGQYVARYLIPEPSSSDDDMPSGIQTYGGRILLTENDEVSPALLTHAAGFLYAEKQKVFALKELGLTDAKFSFIKADFPDDSQRRNYEILKAWHDNDVGMNVSVFIKKLVTWQRDGYFSNDIWSNMGHFVATRLIPQAPPHDFSSTRSADQQESKTTQGFWQQLHAYLMSIWAIFSMRRKLRDSLRRRCKNKLSTDWLPLDKAKRFPVFDYYVAVKQRRKVLKARKDKAEEIKTIHDILKIDVIEGGVNIALRGQAGIGKTSSMALLALQWVKQSSSLVTAVLGKIWGKIYRKNRLAQFSWVFLVELGMVQDDSTLVQIIMKQHMLNDQKIPESQIRSILEGEHGKVLLLLDGYDEYKKGTNSEVDVAIENTVGECFMIVTSREGDYMSPETLSKIDGEVEITGFSKENVQKYATKYLEARDAANDFLDKCNEAGILGILKVPIILLMTLVLYTELEESLPTSRTEIIHKIIFMIIDRGCIRNFEGKKLEDIDGLKESLVRLGELALNAVKNGTLSISEEDVIAISPDLLKLGILHRDFLDEARLEGQDVMMSYPHKLFLEFMGAYYAIDLETENIEDFPFDLFDPAMKNIATFMYQLAEDKQAVLKRLAYLVCNTESVPQCHDLLQSLFYEDRQTVNPLYNAWICSMNDYLPQHNIHSMKYIFDESLPLDWEKEPGPTTSQPAHISCRVYISYRQYTTLDQLLSMFEKPKRPMDQLWLEELDDLPEDEIKFTKPLKLEFAEDSLLMLDNCDMRSDLLKGLLCLHNLLQIINVGLNGILHVPISMFSSLAEAGQLRCLLVSKGQYDFDLSQELSSLVTKLPNLECFGLFGEPRQQDNKQLSDSEKATIFRTLISLGNLKRLFLCDTCWSRALAEACKDIPTPSQSLQVLVLNKAELTAHDIQGLEELIEREMLPSLSELYLQGNDFTGCRASLEKLLRTVDDKLPDCQVLVSQDVHLSYNCLKVQTGPEGLDTGTGWKWLIND